MHIVSCNNAEHYAWGGVCDGGHPPKSANLSVIEERVPPGGVEIKHYHEHGHPFFFVLSGEATFEVEDKRMTLDAHQGISIPAKTPHQLLSEARQDLFFTVVSASMSHGDRVLVD
jgi:mannose-6-phosphate isomerase-like protein (cupin superfamily)